VALVRVLLVSPGGSGLRQGDFGDPHLVALGSYLRARTGAAVELLDLDYEQFLPVPQPARVFDPGFQVVGVSCYSSFDYLAAFYLACEIRRRNPAAVLVVGGYHASARPEDFLNLPGSELDAPSPFDHVIIGEGELPLARIVEAAAHGERLPRAVQGPEPLANLDDLPPLDWTLLDRYRGLGQTGGGQIALSVSRGCPFGCDFCMERSKGESAWRAWSPGRAVRELQALDRWLGLAGHKLFIADAVFGLHPAWRHEMLDRLASLDLGLSKIWTLSRIDLIGPGDAGRFQRAGFGLGFGLESGHAGMLARTGKTHRADEFLARFLDFARESGGIGLPWGANVIVGHPGETRESLESSAQFVAKLFLETDGLTGFLSIDPYRFYPGSTIDRQLPRYEREFGTRIHRPRWWNFSEQAFNSEWVDPSSVLDYRQCSALSAKLFAPIVRGIAKRFAYRGPARDYFLRSVRSAGDDFRPPRRLAMLDCYHLWQGLTGQGRTQLADDPEARDLFRRARCQEARRILRRLGKIRPNNEVVRALIEEPRERFVRREDMLNSWRDIPLRLTADDRATISALHAYLLNFTLLDLAAGDRLIEVGGGTGYGAALAARVIGDRGTVVSYEVLPELAALAEQNLRDRKNVTIVCGDGLAPQQLPPFNKVLFTCAVPQVISTYVDALPEGGRLLAPIIAGSPDAQQVLTRYVRVGGRLRVTRHGHVRYVAAEWD